MSKPDTILNTPVDIGQPAAQSIPPVALCLPTMASALVRVVTAAGTDHGPSSVRPSPGRTGRWAWSRVDPAGLLRCVEPGTRSRRQCDDHMAWTSSARAVAFGRGKAWRMRVAALVRAPERAR